MNIFFFFFFETLFLGGLISYSSTKSSLDKVEWADNLQDISYDGLVNGEQMSGGLGQLTDGVVIDNRTSANGTFFGKDDE